MLRRAHWRLVFVCLVLIFTTAQAWPADQTTIYLPVVSHRPILDQVVTNIRGYRLSDRYRIVGEVYNGLRRPIYDPIISFTGYDAQGQRIRLGDTVLEFPYFAPGTTNPFAFDFPDDLGGPVMRHTLDGVTWKEADETDTEAGPVTVLSHGLSRTGDQVTIAGEITNPLPYTAWANVAVTFYDAAGAVVDVARLERLILLSPGETAPYALDTTNPAAYTRYTVQAGGFRYCCANP